MNIETHIEKPPTRPARWEVGKTYYHLASHNRYQSYTVLSREWDPELIMGSGGWLYNIEFTEYSDSKGTKKVDHWVKKIVEVTLPVDNLTPWVE